MHESRHPTTRRHKARPSPPSPFRAIRIVGSDPAHCAAVSRAVSRLWPSLEARLAGVQPLRAMVVVAHTSAGNNLGRLIVRPGPFAWLWIGMPGQGDPELDEVVAHEFGHLMVEGACGWPPTPTERSLGQQVVVEYLAQRLGAQLTSTLGVPRDPQRAMWLWEAVRREALHSLEEGTDRTWGRLLNALTVLLREWAYAAADGGRPAVGWRTPVAEWIETRPGVAVLLAPIAAQVNRLPEVANLGQIAHFRRTVASGLDRGLAKALGGNDFLRLLAGAA